MTDPVDKTNWLWCRGCNSPQPPEQRVGFRCAKCAARSKNSPNKWLFDAAGNVISKGTKPAKAKAPAATEALKTNKEQSK